MRSMLAVACLSLALFVSLPVRAAGTLELYFIDVEGGQATLMVSPSGESLLVDTGWGGNDGRDAKRIAATVQRAGVKVLDYLVITHYHDDHVGGMAQLAELVKFRTVITHGPNTEDGKTAILMAPIFQKAMAMTGAKEVVVKPGDVIPIKGLDIKVVASNRALIALPTANPSGNPRCDGAVRSRPDTSDNSASVGMLITLGRFRFLDIGDVTQDLEFDLACPVNRIGEVDLFLTTHHGSRLSNAQVLVHSLNARVAIMNNGASKGGDLPVLKTVRSAPGLEDLWMLHYSVASGDEGNVAEQLIANLKEPAPGTQDDGFGMHVSADDTGAFTVTNERNKVSKRYPARQK